MVYGRYNYHEVLNGVYKATCWKTPPCRFDKYISVVKKIWLFSAFPGAAIGLKLQHISAGNNHRDLML
jgi:hypothetical protein